MKIPKYVDELLGYQGRSGRVKLIRQITDYHKYPDCIAGYLYRIDLEKYTHPACFEKCIKRFCAWAERMHAETKIHAVRLAGWQTYAIVSITDPVSLAFEKAGFIEK